MKIRMHYKELENWYDALVEYGDLAVRHTDPSPYELAQMNRYVDELWIGYSPSYDHLYTPKKNVGRARKREEISKVSDILNPEVTLENTPTVHVTGFVHLVLHMEIHLKETGETNEKYCKRICERYKLPYSTAVRTKLNKPVLYTVHMGAIKRLYTKLLTSKQAEVLDRYDASKI